MKRNYKIISVVLIMAVLLSLAAFSASSVTYYIRGDADENNQVDISDVYLVQKVLAELEPDTKGVIKRNCDVDQNGLDIADATSIQYYLAEYNNPYYIGKRFSYDEYELPYIPSGR
ncbi:MAG: hypothetical protein IJ598_05645 [Ruminococcus sp.]|nr:hypothetical protein [Ruminococcus sp.]